MKEFNMGIQRCVRCTLPITWETLCFDDEGVCNICRNWEVKQDVVDWIDREKQFKNIVNDIKEQNNEYDCIVPFSGGKDSTFTLWAVVKKYGLKPLVVSFDHLFYRPRTIDNRKRTFRRLGVDVLTFTPNWKIVRKLMVESLIRKGDFCWHCHAGIFAYPMNIAIKFQIPMLIWGEGGGEYEDYFKLTDLEETDEWKFNRRTILGMRAEDMAGFIDVDLKDLAPYIYPTKEELDTIGAISLSLGNYVPWDQEKQTEIIKKELGWQEDEIESLYPNTLSFDKVECMFTGIRDYIKLLKRGFSRITHRTTIDIKQGKITRDEAIKLIDKYEKRKPRSLSVFLEYIDMPEDEFNDICLKHVIPPAKPVDPKTIPDGDKLWDQDLWFRDAEK
jgi:N-acetyl sugar amidotransferase